MTLYTQYQFQKSLKYQYISTYIEVIRAIHTLNSNKYLYKHI